MVIQMSMSAAENVYFRSNNLAEDQNEQPKGPNNIHRWNDRNDQ